MNAEIKAQSERLYDIQNSIKSLNSFNDPLASQTRSPLVESIIHENIDKILTEVSDLNVKSTEFFGQYLAAGRSTTSPPSLSVSNTHDNEIRTQSHTQSQEILSNSSQDILSNSLLYSELERVDRSFTEHSRNLSEREFAGQSNSHNNNTTNATETNQVPSGSGHASADHVVNAHSSHAGMQKNKTLDVQFSLSDQLTNRVSRTEDNIAGNFPVSMDPSGADYRRP